jgi:hypothetical protein
MIIFTRYLIFMFLNMPFLSYFKESGLDKIIDDIKD